MKRDQTGIERDRGVPYDPNFHISSRNPQGGGRKIYYFEQFSFGKYLIMPDEIDAQRRVVEKLQGDERG